MVAGELYKASKVEPEYKPDNNRALNQEINQLNRKYAKTSASESINLKSP